MGIVHIPNRPIAAPNPFKKDAYLLMIFQLISGGLRRRTSPRLSRHN
jgi:hypothetical protein